MKVEWFKFESIRGTFGKKHAFIDGSNVAACGERLPLATRIEGDGTDFCMKCERHVAALRESEANIWKRKRHGGDGVILEEGL